MDNIEQNKRLKYIWQDKKYTRDTINNINHTNINNNINITNYYPSPSQGYCNKGTFDFINNNVDLQNHTNYSIANSTHKTKTSKDISPTPSTGEKDKKYHQCQSPYMKKILPPSKRQQSDEGNRILNIYKSSPSTKFIKNIKKNPLKNDLNNNNSIRKNITQNFNKNNKQNKRSDNYYFDLSSDDINNKYNTNFNSNNKSHTNNKYSTNRNYQNCNKTKTNNSNKSEIIQNSNNVINKLRNRPLLNINRSMISNKSNEKDNLFKINQKPKKVTIFNNEPLFKMTSPEKKEIISFNNISPKFFKSQKNLNIKRKKNISVEKKINHYIILIQSVTRGFLLRIKLSQYLSLYERIKKALSIIKYKIIQKVKYFLYFKLKNYMQKNFNNNYNYNNKNKYNYGGHNYHYSYLTPSNNISLEFKNRSMKKYRKISNESYSLKYFNNYNSSNNIFYQENIMEKNKKQANNNEIAEIHKELNKKKIDFAVAQKKIKELTLENKKVQNINNIIVRDNRQLALKLKNMENNRYNNMEIQNNNFYYICLSHNNDIKNKIKINNTLLKLFMKKEMMFKTILYKFFYKFFINSKIIDINEKNKNDTLIIENNNFILNKNVIEKVEKGSNTTNDNGDCIENRNKILKRIINRKNINLYMYRNIFEKWMLRAIIFKNKDFIKEKKKKKKEKFKQRKQRKMYGYYMEKNDKKNNDEDNDNSAESDDFDIEEKYNK